ncbi:YcaO-like family protein [Spirillospora sp. NPDC050679]
MTFSDPITDHAAALSGMATRPRQAGEREFDLATAWRLGRQAAAEAGLTMRLTDVGEAWRCLLYRTDGTPAPGGTGSGKGPAEDARVGALFEALEHYRSGASLLNADRLVARRAADLADGPFAGDPALAALDPDALLACRPHTALSGSGTLDVPVFLQCPGYLAPRSAALRHQAGDTCDYASAVRYSSNNGTAIGATRAEALVHALAEAIERDAKSILLATTFLAEEPHSLRLVDPATLPDEVAALQRHARQRVAGPVHLIDMTTDLDVPAYLAHAAAHPRHLRAGMVAPARFGMGASLSSVHAARRALSELLQVVALDEELQSAPRDLSHLRRYPRLLAAATVDLAAHLPRAATIDFTETTAPATPEQHVRHLAALLADHGHPPYAHTLHTASNGVSTIAVAVPGLDRFFIVTGGNAVIPGPRARRCITGDHRALRSE